MRKRREDIGFTAETALDMAGFADNPAHWFAGHTDLGAQVWFLAHAVDGVIWGRVTDGVLETADAHFPTVSPKLRFATLQEARLFGSEAEVRVWRGDGGFLGCRISDVPETGALAFEESHRLWGTVAQEHKNGFTLLADGREGLRHAPPLDVPDTAFRSGVNERYRPAALHTRHYIRFDEFGQAYIAASRLVGLTVESRTTNREASA